MRASKENGGEPKIGLALSGGGARGLAHIGVLKVLEQEGISVDLLAGTSMGGVVAAAYAAGLTPDFMEQEALRMTNPRRLLSLADPTLPRRGLFEGQKVTEYLSRHLGECTFDSLRCPLSLIAVDLEAGEAVTLNEGQVIDAVRATIALPGLFKPVERESQGESQSKSRSFRQVLVDGGLLDNLPADVTRQMGADVVIAVDVIGDNSTFSAMIKTLHERRYVPGGLASTFEVMLRSLDVMMKEINRRCLVEAAPEVIIRPDVPPDVSVLLGFTRAADTIAIGEKAAVGALPDIRSVLEATAPAQGDKAMKR
jgi:NTE family protein